MVKTNKEDLKQQNMELVLQITEQCLNEYGIGDTTIELIAKKSNLTPRSIHRYFKNRNNLLLVFVEQFVDKYYRIITDALEDLEKEDKQGIELIQMFFNLHYHLFQTEYTKIVLMNEIEIYFSKQSDTDNVFKQYIAKTREIYNQFSKLLERGIQDGSIREDLDVKITTEMVVNVCISLMQRVSLIYNKDFEAEIPKALKQLNECGNMLFIYLRKRDSEGEEV